MNKLLLTEFSIFLLLILSKSSSMLINISPFLAVIIISSYFVGCKYRFLAMICIAQLSSDLIYGVHISNLFVYLSYLFIVLLLFNTNKIFSFGPNMFRAIQANIIFFLVSNIGHFLVFSNQYTVAKLLGVYDDGLIYAANLFVSTVVFLAVFHALLAVSRKRLAKTRSTRVS